jgi:hypothetical protein
VHVDPDGPHESTVVHLTTDLLALTAWLKAAPDQADQPVVACELDDRGGRREVNVPGLAAFLAALAVFSTQLGYLLTLAREGGPGRLLPGLLARADDEWSQDASRVAFYAEAADRRASRGLDASSPRPRRHLAAVTAEGGPQR